LAVVEKAVPVPTTSVEPLAIEIVPSFSEDIYSALLR
jgi:hypothetical protein